MLYLDFDGVLHSYFAQGVYRIGALLDGHLPEKTFCHAPILVDLLTPHPEVKIVLSTSWVRSYGMRYCLRNLIEPLRERVIGATWRDAYEIDMPEIVKSRGGQVLHDVELRQPGAWIALDDDCTGWQHGQGNLVLCNRALGLGSHRVRETLKARLEQL